jgi:hypothetical protein
MEEKYTLEGNRAPLSIKPTEKNSWKIRPSVFYRVFFLHKYGYPVTPCRGPARIALIFVQ